MDKDEACWPFSVKNVGDGEGGLSEDVYFLYFNILCQGESPDHYLSELGFNINDFVIKANKLFKKLDIRKIPEQYPKNCDVKSEFNEKATGRKAKAEPWIEFVLCIASCIILEDDYRIDTSKIIRKELIEPNSRDGILHAYTLAIIILHYSKKGATVSIIDEKDNTDNPDLEIDSIKCEVKTVDTSDWTKELISDNNLYNRFLETGRGKQHKKSEDFCFDIGRFISDRACKGIKQGEMIFADLSLKSFRYFFKNKNITSGMPELKKNRIIFFYKMILDIKSFYIDFAPMLWEIIKTNNETHRMGIYPPPSNKNK